MLPLPCRAKTLVLYLVFLIYSLLVNTIMQTAEAIVKNQNWKMRLGVNAQGTFSIILTWMLLLVRIFKKYAVRTGKALLI